MKKRQPRLIVLLTLSAQTVSATAMPATPRLEFENNLRRTISIEGQAQRRFTLADRMAHYKVPGVSVAIVDHCRIVDTPTFGLDAVNGKPLSSRTLFQAASLSKPLVAVAALKLVERSKLTLDGDVAQSLRTWTLPKSQLTVVHPVTLRELLSHTAGVNEENYEGYAAGQPVPAWPAILSGTAPANTGPVRVETTPGSAWHYSGPGYLIAQTLMTDTTV